MIYLEIFPGKLLYIVNTDSVLFVTRLTNKAGGAACGASRCFGDLLERAATPKLWCLAWITPTCCEAAVKGFPGAAGAPKAPLTAKPHCRSGAGQPDTTGKDLGFTGAAAAARVRDAKDLKPGDNPLDSTVKDVTRRTQRGNP